MSGRSLPEGYDIAALLNVFQYLDLSPEANIIPGDTIAKFLSNKDNFDFSGPSAPDQERQYAKLLAARDVIRAAGYGEYFTHSLGHSLGLEIHEKPVLSEKEDARLEAGMLITVEPGIYLPGRGGVRIEDVALVTESGAEVLTQSPRELIIV